MVKSDLQGIKKGEDENMKKVFSIPKIRIVIVSASVVVVLAITVVVIACLNVGKKPDDDLSDTAGAVGAVARVDESSAPSDPSDTGREEDSVTAAPVRQLAFESKGNGNCAVVGIGSLIDEDVEIPRESPDGELVTEIANGAFENCKTMVTVHIPATVKSIGSGAFVGCSSLQAITVDSSNTEYSSVGNVLFSKDKTVLICYPAARVGSSYLLSTNVRKISAYAFDGVTVLRKILYRGTVAKYQEIVIDVGNSTFTNMPIEFNYKGEKP